MLKRLHLKNFTVFADANFEFGPGLNVLVGTNGTGKSHVLKLGYSIEIVRERNKNEPPSGGFPYALDFALSEPDWPRRLSYFLPEVFQTASRKQLVSTLSSLQTANIEAEFGDGFSQNETVQFEINAYLDSVSVISGGEFINEKLEIVAPVFIPAKEILTLSWMLPASEQLVLPIEQNYLHLLRQLRLLPLRKVNSAQAISALTNVLGGEVKEEEGKYYLIATNGKRTAMNMVAEGLRKFGTLQKLLANGSLTSITTLFWDEPEANLNPALLRKLAAILAELARQGFQIILATHSTDLLKEFHILSRQKDAAPLPIKYFGLNAEPGEATRIVTTDNFEFLPDVVALAEELKQADELEEIFIREDQEYHANNRRKE
ncbi:AAA family ATPase [Hymenobacter armeniacus]|uniref:ATP-binding protein n=1 Tax=Hymenobacter armeniacus TaxID=2771358 RepID=A0ABR8JUD2_9BACT|nr:AAA family ATPase [Hymenobacter armeniacus]MBD2722386.1 ATP-binding protein [Hymenobacter armeniacus]